MSDPAARAAGPDEDLDAAIEQARAALSAMLRADAAGEGSRPVAEARALLASLLDQRLARAVAGLDEDDPATVRADRDEAIAVTAALLYELPPGDPAWRHVALMVGRLSYDRYRDAWPGAQPPDPDDLDAACDLLARGARAGEADERTARYLFLALRDRRKLLASLAEAGALVTWGSLLPAFPGADGPGQGSLHTKPTAWSIPRQRSLRFLAACR
jgi:hypothetical protein